MADSAQNGGIGKQILNTTELKTIRGAKGVRYRESLLKSISVSSACLPTNSYG